MGIYTSKTLKKAMNKYSWKIMKKKQWVNIHEKNHGYINMKKNENNHGYIYMKELKKDLHKYSWKIMKKIIVKYSWKNHA